MKRLVIHLVAVVAALAALPSRAPAQGTRDDYARAERFLSPQVDRLVSGVALQPNWIDSTPTFWYRADRFGLREFVLVDARANTSGPAFDHARLAAGLSRTAGREYRADSLPFNSFDFIQNRGAVRFDLSGARYSCELATYSCTVRSAEQVAREGREATSPDGRWVAFLRDHNVHVRSVQTGEVVRLSDDGGPLNEYATGIPSPTVMAQQRTSQPELRVSAVWSPDSRRLVAHRVDQRSAGRLTLVQNVPPAGVRPVSYTYAYPLPGDVGVPVAVPVVFDIVSRTRVPIATEPLQMLYYGGPQIRWLPDSRRVYFTWTERGYRRTQLREADAATGQVRVLAEDTAATFVDPHNTFYRILGGGAEVLWASQRDGWTHLYLYDGATGRMVRQLTRGQWVVREIVGVDERARVAYFTAAGREPNRDPYFRHLYRVNLDGTGLRLLTPENADHAVTVSLGGEFFTDSYSRADTVPVAVLRRTSDGSVVRALERADIAPLLATGWRWPEPFRAPAADGRTEMYGIIWRPSTFDPSRRYPVVEQIYTGPQGYFTPKTFAAFRNHAQAVAELGFIVVQMDGPGTNFRGRAFLEAAFRNLGGGALTDRIAVFRRLAERYPYLDLTRVGVYGHSAGGYDAAHALLTHPEFYRVGVSSAGNHDHRLDKAWWNELWMGFPLGDHYREQSNVTLAHRLEGRLLLAHGDMDENVPPSETMQLADALIKANKDFDLLILPNRNHGFGTDPYFVRRRWDFLVRHLWGVEPPRGYAVGGQTAAR
jgi:dipeptidyl aminopeptidase/acylaminoacyl peptidase